jgi:hypothetical protein
MTDPNDLLASADEVTDDGVFQVVGDSYDAVYASLSEGDTFNRLWRSHACNDDSRQISLTLDS